MNICVVSYVMNGVSVVVVRLFIFTNLKSGMGQPIVVSIVLIKIRIRIEEKGMRKREL